MTMDKWWRLAQKSDIVYGEQVRLSR